MGRGEAAQPQRWQGLAESDVRRCGAALLITNVKILLRLADMEPAQRRGSRHKRLSVLWVPDYKHTELRACCHYG